MFGVLLSIKNYCYFFFIPLQIYICIIVYKSYSSYNIVFIEKLQFLHYNNLFSIIYGSHCMYL